MYDNQIVVIIRSVHSNYIKYDCCVHTNNMNECLVDSCSALSWVLMRWNIGEQDDGLAVHFAFQ